MKKSFMTRVLATGLSVAMAFSLSTATNLVSAQAASKPVLVDYTTGGSGKTMTVNLNETAKLKVNAATKTNYKIASVKPSSNKLRAAVNNAGTVVTVRGLVATEENKPAAIKVSFTAKKTGKTSKYTFASKVTVVNPEPEVVALAISDVKQTASNAFNVTFNKDASKDVTKDNLTVKTTDGTTELSVKSVEFSADGLSAAVTVFGTLVDAKEYVVATGDASKTFTASVGEVANVVITTASAELNTATKIEFELRDANGIDVTPSVALDTHCIVSIEGSYSTAEIARASEAKITMTTVGDVAKVTVTYNANKTGATDIVGTQDITCVAATAKVGSVLFAQTDDTNNDNLCAKFYQGLTSTEVKVGNNGGTDDVYFCATKDGEVISYDSYTVESANDNVASATTDSIGKYAKITVTGNNVGTTQLNITASKNGVESFYTIPVRVTTVGVATSMTASGDKSQMSDAQDNDYKLKITAKLKDADNQDVDGTYTLERTSTAGEGATFSSTSSDGKFSVDVSGVQNLSTNSWTRITFKVTGADNVTGKQFSKNVVVDVKKLPDVLTNIDYKIEISSETVDQASYKSDGTGASVTTKLYATSNGLFAGYVGGTGADSNSSVSTGGITASLSDRTVESKSAIEVITGCALFGNEKFDNGDVIDATGTEKTLTNTAASAMTFATVQKASDGKVYTAASTTAAINGGNLQASTVAKTGTYTVKYTLLINGKAKTLTKTFVVKNSYVTPTVKISSNKADNINDITDIIKNNMVSNVDMNDNESDATSIISVYKKVGSLYDEASATNNKVIIQGAAVEDTINGVNWVFFVNAAATFTQK